MGPVRADIPRGSPSCQSGRVPSLPRAARSLTVDRHDDAMPQPKLARGQQTSGTHAFMVIILAELAGTPSAGAATASACRMRRVGDTDRPGSFRPSGARVEVGVELDGGPPRRPTTSCAPQFPRSCTASASPAAAESVPHRTSQGRRLSSVARTQRRPIIRQSRTLRITQLLGLDCSWFISIPPLPALHSVQSQRSSFLFAGLEARPHPVAEIVQCGEPILLQNSAVLLVSPGGSRVLTIDRSTTCASLSPLRQPVALTRDVHGSSSNRSAEWFREPADGYVRLAAQGVDGGDGRNHAASRVGQSRSVPCSCPCPSRPCAAAPCGSPVSVRGMDAARSRKSGSPVALAQQAVSTPTMSRWSGESRGHAGT